MTYTGYRNYIVMPPMWFELLSDSLCSGLSLCVTALLELCFTHHQLTLPRSRAAAVARIEGAEKGDQKKDSLREKVYKGLIFVGYLSGITEQMQVLVCMASFQKKSFSA